MDVKQETPTSQRDVMVSQQIAVLPSVPDPKAEGAFRTDSVVLLPNLENINKSEGDLKSATITDRSDPDGEKNMTHVCKNQRSGEIPNTDREVGVMAPMAIDEKAKLSVYYCFPDRSMTELNAEQVLDLAKPEVSVPTVTASVSPVTDSDPVTTEASSSAVSAPVTQGTSKTTVKDPVTLESSKTTHIYYSDGSMTKLKVEVKKPVTLESSTTTVSAPVTQTVSNPVTLESSTITHIYCYPDLSMTNLNPEEVQKPVTLESSATTVSDLVIPRTATTTVSDPVTLKSSTTTVSDPVTQESSTTTVSDPVTLESSITVSDPVTLESSTTKVSDPVTQESSTTTVSDPVTLESSITVSDPVTLESSTTTVSDPVILESSQTVSDPVTLRTGRSTVSNPVTLRIARSTVADPFTLESSTSTVSDQVTPESPLTIDVNKVLQCDLQNVAANRPCNTKQLHDKEKEQTLTRMSTPNSGNISAPITTSASLVPNQASISQSTTAAVVQDKTVQSVSKFQITPSVIPIKLHANVNLHFGVPTSVCEGAIFPQPITRSVVETPSSQSTVSVASVIGSEPDSKHEHTVPQTVTPPTSSVCSTVFVHKDLETAVSKMSQASMESPAGQLASPCTESILKFSPDCLPNVISVPVSLKTLSCPQGGKVCSVSANLSNKEALFKSSCSTPQVQNSTLTSVSSQKQPEEVKTPTSDQKIVYVNSPSIPKVSQKYYVMCTKDKKLLVPISKLNNLKDGLKSQTEAVSKDKAKVLTLSLVKSAQSKSAPLQLDGNSDLEVTKEENQSNKLPQQILDPLKGVKHEGKTKRKIKRGMSRKLKQCKCCYVVLHPYYVRSKDTTVRTRKAKFMNCSERCRSAFLSSYFKKHKDLKTPRQIWRNMYDKNLALEQAESVDDSDTKEKGSDGASPDHNILEVISNSGYYGQTKVEKYKLTSSSLEEGETILKEGNFSSENSPKRTLKLCLLKPKDTVRNPYDGMRSSATVTQGKETLGSTKLQKSSPKSRTVNIEYVFSEDSSQKRTDDATAKAQEMSEQKPDLVAVNAVGKSGLTNITSGVRPVFVPASVVSNSGLSCIGGRPPLVPVTAVEKPILLSALKSRFPNPTLRQIGNSGLYRSAEHVKPPVPPVTALGNSGLYTSLEIPTLVPVTAVGNAGLSLSGVRPQIVPLMAAGNSGLSSSLGRPTLVPVTAVGNSGLSNSLGRPTLVPVTAARNSALSTSLGRPTLVPVTAAENSSLSVSGVRPQIFPGTAVGNSGLSTLRGRSLVVPVTAAVNSALSTSGFKPPIIPVTALGNSGLSKQGVRSPLVPVTAMGNSSLSMSGVRPLLVPGTVGNSGLSTSGVRPRFVPRTVGNSGLSTSGVRHPLVAGKAVGNSGLTTLRVRPQIVPVTAKGNSSLSLSGVRPRFVPGTVGNSGLTTSGVRHPVVTGTAVGTSGFSSLIVRSQVVPVKAVGNSALSTPGVRPQIVPITAMGNSGLSTLGVRSLVPPRSVGNSSFSVSGVRPTLVPVITAVGNSRPPLAPVTAQSYSGSSNFRPIYVPVTSLNNYTVPGQTGAIPVSGFVPNLSNASYPAFPMTLVANLASSKSMPKPVLATSTKAGSSSVLTTSKTVQVGHVTAVTKCSTLVLTSLASQPVMGAAPSAKLANAVSTPGTKQVITPVTTPGSRYVSASALSGAAPAGGPVATSSQLGVPIKSFPGSYVINNVFGVSQTSQIGMPSQTLPASSNSMRNSDVSAKTHATGQLSSVPASSNIVQIPVTRTTVQGAPVRSVLAARLPLNSNAFGVLNQALAGPVNRLANPQSSMMVPNSATSKGILLVATIPTCRSMPIQIVPLTSYGITLPTLTTRSGPTVASTTAYQFTSTCAPCISSTVMSSTPSMATSGSFSGFQVKPEPITEGYGDERDTAVPVVSVKAEPMDRGYSDEIPREMNTCPQRSGKRKALDDYNSDTASVPSKRLKRSNVSHSDSTEEENSYRSVVVKTEPVEHESETDQNGQDQNMSTGSVKQADKPQKPETKDEPDIAWHREKVRSLQQKLKETLKELDELKKKS